MNDQQFSKTLRLVLLALMLGLGAIAAVVAFRNNPNTTLKRLQRQIERTYQDSIAPMQERGRTLSIIEPEQLRAEQTYYSGFQNKLESIDQQRLTPKNRGIYQTLSQEVSARLAFLDQLRHDPALYNLGGKLKVTLSRPETPLPTRLEMIEAQLREAMHYFAVAKENLQSPKPEKTQLSIEKQLLTLEFLQSELPDSIALAQLDEAKKAALFDQLQHATLAVKDYLAFCKSLQFEHRDSTFLKPG